MISIIVVNVLFLLSTVLAGDEGQSSLGATTSCMTSYGFSDKYLGSVTQNKTRDCSVDPKEKDASCLRSTLCCAPQGPDDTILTFRFFSPKGQEKNVTWSDERAKSEFDQCSKVVYVIHGYQDFFELGDFNKPVKDAWVQHKKACVVFVDWRKGAGSPYFQAGANTETVGMAVAYSIHKWGIASKTLVTGFSLGGQAVGAAGKHYKKLTNGQQIPECHMIDPAGPYFDGCPAEHKIQEDDCRITQVLHSSAQKGGKNLQFTGYGSYRKAGKCDYWINCGYMGDQKNCPEVPSGIGQVFSLTEKYSCDHYRSARVYVAHLSKKCSFKGQKCPNCSDPKMKDGTSIDRCLSGAGKADEPFITDNECKERQDYYIKVTDGNFPFCDSKHTK